MVYKGKGGVKSPTRMSVIYCPSNGWTTGEFRLAIVYTRFL